jgi:integrase
VPRLTSTPLTQKIIDATRPPKTGFTPLRDPSLQGLLLRIWASGARIWSLEYRSPITGKNVRHGLKLPSGTLIEARARARELRTGVAAGRDPALEAKQDLIARQVAHSAAVTVADALGRYEDAVVKTAARMVSRRARMASLRKAVEPFNIMPVASLKRETIVLRLDEIQATRGPIARNRAQSEIRVWQTWMRNRGIVETIELDRVRKEVKEQARERVLTDEELTVLMTATTDRTPFSDLIRVLMHTGMRRGEAANLQPRDLDFDAATIRVRSEVSKTRQSRLIPIDEAIEPMLRERASRVDREGYVFGDGSDYRRPFSGWGKRVAALVKVMPEGEPWTLHDIRRTVATRLYEAGIDVLTVEDLLGHTTGVRSGVAGTYNRAQTLERQRRALRCWAAQLAAFVETAEGKREADTGQNFVKLQEAR